VSPTAIEVDRGAGLVTIDWEDGHRSVYTASLLRWACPCALCRGEWGRPGRLASLATLPDDELRLMDMYSVGSYAVTPVWASGHAQGIYSFEYLRSLCPCSDCTRLVR